jgi:hypothetical protein
MRRRISSSVTGAIEAGPQPGGLVFQLAKLAPKAVQARCRLRDRTLGEGAHREVSRRLSMRSATT